MLTRNEITRLRKKAIWHDERIQPLFRALSDSNRCRILRLLIHSAATRTFSVSDFASLLAVSLPTASEHLRILEEGGVVRRSRQKQRVIYALRDDEPLVRSVVSVMRSARSAKIALAG